MHDVREIIIGLLREPDETMCVECVATALGQQVGVVMMTMLGLPDRVASFQGVCFHLSSVRSRYQACSP